MVFLFHELALVIGLMLLTKVRAEEFYGRHVCSQQKTESRAVPVQQTYRRAIFKTDQQRVTYQTAYRTVFRMQIHAELTPGCCPGWQKRSPRDVSCAKPICSEACENGGQCVGPNLCLCTDGFTGYRCHVDIDECTGRNRCQQKCSNAHGSYQCSCQAGFRLADDKYTCDLCLNCTREFQDLQDKLETLETNNRYEETLADMKRQLENLTDTKEQENMFEHFQQQLDNFRKLGLQDGRLQSLEAEITSLQGRVRELDGLPDLRLRLDNLLKRFQEKEIFTARFLGSYTQIENEFRNIAAMKRQIQSLKKLEDTVSKLQADDSELRSHLVSQVKEVINNKTDIDKANTDKMAEITRELVELRDVKIQVDTLKDQLERISGRLENLEAEKAELKNSLQAAVSQCESARNARETVGVSSEHGPSTDLYEVDPHKMPLDRLASLSEQISILEERMADCACGQDYHRG